MKSLLYDIQKFCSFLIGVQSDLEMMGRHRKLGLWLSSDMTAWAYLITRKLLDKMSPPSSIVIRLQVSGHVIVIMIDMLPHHVSLTTRGYGVQDQWKNFIMMYASVYHKIGVQCMQSHMTTTVYPWITGWLEKLQKNFNISTTSMLSKPFLLVISRWAVCRTLSCFERWEICQAID